MTIDEAINHAREIAMVKRADADWKWRNGILNADDCISCAEEHEQLAEWLEELKEYRSVNRVEQNTIAYQNGYTTAIDDFAEKIQWEYLNSCGIKQQEIDFLIAVSSQVAEQLKEGGVE